MGHFLAEAQRSWHGVSASQAWGRLPFGFRWGVAAVLLLLAGALTLQMAVGVLWKDAIFLRDLANRSEDPAIFWAYLPQENRARLPSQWAGELRAPGGGNWEARWRGAQEFLLEPGDYTFTASTVWFRIPQGSPWQDAVLLLPRAVPGAWFLILWCAASLALAGAWPWWRGFWGRKAPGVWSRGMVFLGGAFLFSLWRKPEWLLAPQLVNEDVWVFAYGAWAQGGSVLWQPYAGYWHFLPRLGAQLFADLSPALWPLAYAWLAWLLAVGLGLVVAFSRICPDWRIRFLMGWSLFWVPNGGEVYFQLYNIQWLSLGVLLLLLLQSPAKDASTRWSEAVLAGVLGITTPGVLFIVPLLGWRIWRAWRHPVPERDENAGEEDGHWGEHGYESPFLERCGAGRRLRWEMPLVGATAVAACLQLWVMLGGETAHRGSAFVQPLRDFFINFLLITMPSFFPARGVSGPEWMLLALALCWFGALAWLWLKADTGTRQKVGVLLLYGGGILLVGFLRPAGGAEINVTRFSPTGEASRYYFLLGQAVWWSVLLLQVSFFSPAVFKPWRKKILAGALLLSLVWAQATQMRVRPHPDFDWTAQAEKLARWMHDGRTGEAIELRFPYGHTWSWVFPSGNP